MQYQFTKDQLTKLLAETINMYFEYRNVHGGGVQQSIDAAINEAFEGMDAETELLANGEKLKPTFTRVKERQLYQTCVTCGSEWQAIPEDGPECPNCQEIERQTFDDLA